ncbi:MAG TPA: PIN domain-containing protein, partial [Patescibacteria group bacterium]|nr:PIN domain-containing protein [Patescibacteria group bacterium]
PLVGAAPAGFIASFARHRFIPALIGSMTRIIQLTGALLGTLIGFALGLALLQRAGDLIDEANRPAFLTAFVVATLLFGYLAIPYITIYPVRRAVEKLSEAGAGEFALGVAAVVIGLLMGVLVGIPLAQVGGVLGSVGPPVVSLFLAFLMLAATMSKRDVLLPAFGGIIPGARRTGPSTRVVIDTSAVIDGRIVDIARTGFILGNLIVPRFVLDELQRIADSPDALRRNRGRRGLEMLSALQKDAVTPVEISESTYPEVPEVDAKLMAYARDHGAAILTNDYNLNRVADLQGIRVLNVNELANAVKAVVHPGEEMSVRIIQEGKEAGQGVGYLDDGTMIVVEGGLRFLNQEIPIAVTRVLQTVAGRMIFAQPRGEAG